MRKIFIVLSILLTCCVNPIDDKQKLEAENSQLKQEVGNLKQTLIKRASEPLNPTIITPTKDMKGYLSYSNTDQKFSISYPKDWDAVENYNPIIFFLTHDPITKRSFNVIVIQEETRSFTDVALANKTEMKAAFPDYLMISEERVVIGDKQGLTFTSTFTNPKNNAKSSTVTYFFLQDNKSYIITFSTLPTDIDSYKPIITSIMSTFQCGIKN